ncbi:hypothetical protein [Moorena sp. SIO3I6]|uniref:hypothetical protein n=1 Tax=Moorena sp. SIO3I6 TaxID=2607831 RepID=UPI0013F6E649|nr:hypothetical protein [Moorena sp. SIO3I6]NEP21454.1 hypothetical protein [Moorena sp. SIO3I6]
MAENKLPGKPNINTEGGNYSDRIGGDYIQGDKGDTTTQSGSLGMGISEGTTNAHNLGGTINQKVESNCNQAQNIYNIENLNFVAPDVASGANRLQTPVNKPQQTTEHSEAAGQDQSTPGSYLTQNNGKNPSNTPHLGKLVSSDHKYKGHLVHINLQFVRKSGVIDNKEIAIKLDISFGEVEQVVVYKKKPLLGKNTEAHIRFGVKRGELEIEFTNGTMPPEKRRLKEDPKGECKINATGINEAPTWQFKAREKSGILEGQRTVEELGIVELSDSPCIAEATFNVSISSNGLEITAQDGAWNSETESKLKIETKRRAFFKRFVEPILKDYVSKVVLQYD